MNKIHTILLLAFATLLCGCGEQHTSSHTNGDGQINYAEFKIALSAVSHVAFTGIHATTAELHPTIIGLEAGPNIVQSLRSTASSSGHAGNLAIEPVAAMILSDANPIIIGTTITGGKNVKLVTPSESGVSADPESLRGKKIGVVLDTIGESYLLGLLKKGGLRESDVVIVNGLPTQLMAGIYNGSLDAAVLWSPFLKIVQREYANRIKENPSLDKGAIRVFNDPDVFSLNMLIVTTRDKLRQERSDLKRLLQSFISAEIAINADRTSHQVAVENWLGLQSGDLSDFFSDAEFTLKLDVPKIISELRLVVDRSASKRGVIAPIDLSHYIDTSLLQEVDSGRVVTAP